MSRKRSPWFRKDKGCWFVWFNGRQVRLHKEKAEAYRLWHQLEAEGIPVSTTRRPDKAGTVIVVVDSYLASALSTLKPSTVSTRIKILKRLKAELGEEDAASLTPKIVLGWLDKQTGWGRSTRWLASCIVKTVFRPVAPGLAELKLPGPRSRGAETLVSAGQHDVLLTSAPPTYRDALTVLWATGCRPCELCSVEARHLDAEASALVLPEHKADRTGKPRIILLPPAALEIVRRLAALHPSGPLFRNCQGQPLTTERLRNWLFKTRRRLRLGRVIAYGYRHSFATDALAKGVADAQVAELLGHAGTAMLHRHYAHLTARTHVMREALARVRG